MRNRLIVLPVFLALSLAASSQTAEELVQKNIAAKGGMEKIKAIKTLRLIGKLDAGGGFTAAVGGAHRSRGPGRWSRAGGVLVRLIRLDNDHQR